MSFKILTCEQRSIQWCAARRGIFTASEVGDFVADPKPTKTNQSARRKLILKKLAEPLYTDPDFADLPGSAWLTELRAKEEKAMQYNPAVQRGIQLEPLAKARYQELTGHTVDEVGMCIHDSGGFGCSPDGMIPIIRRNDGEYDWSHGLEIKCPIPETHQAYLLDGKLPDCYRPQIAMSLAVTGFNRWDFMSFCPGFPSLILTVERDEYTEKMLAGLISLVEEMNETRAKISELWEKEFSK